jgi:hypothetical protein
MQAAEGSGSGMLVQTTCHHTTCPVESSCELATLHATPFFRIFRILLPEGVALTIAFTDMSQMEERIKILEDSFKRSSWLGDLAEELFDYTEANASASSIPAFKSGLMKAYSGQTGGQEMAFCMLTHQLLPKKYVIGSHLWKRQWAR